MAEALPGRRHRRSGEGRTAAGPNTHRHRIAVGYMRNATVQIVQPFTRDHGRAADALRMPLGSGGAYSSPYLSVADLMSRWPASQNRREVVMITDGIDRAHRHWHWRRGLHPNPDADTASAVAQKSGTIIRSLYAPGVGPWRRNYWEASAGRWTWPGCRTRP